MSSNKRVPSNRRTFVNSGGCVVPLKVFIDHEAALFKRENKDGGKTRKERKRYGVS